MFSTEEFEGIAVAVDRELRKRGISEVHQVSKRENSVVLTYKPEPGIAPELAARRLSALQRQIEDQYGILLLVNPDPDLEVIKSFAATIG